MNKNTDEKKVFSNQFNISFISFQSFFGRSYNNVQSISECKNGGECIINKKNRTACKACRLRKCLEVGMSKGGSRYGRRSNWFKINFLLQEEQQKAVQAAAAAVAGNDSQIDKMKSTNASSPSSALNLFAQSTYSSAAMSYARSKENLKMLGYDEYTTGQMTNHSMASPSVSSPESHNSDSSIEISDRHATSKQQTNSTHDSSYPSLPFNKELFLPLSYPAFATGNFLHQPTSHFLFPGYHPALFAHHQGLLKPAIDPTLLLNPAHILNNNNSRMAPNHNNKSAAEELSKYYWDAMLKAQQNDANDLVKINSNEQQMPQSLVTKRMTHSPIEFESCKRKKIVSPTPTASSIRSETISPGASSTNGLDQDIPIDLSMKSSRSMSPNEPHQSTSPTQFETKNAFHTDATSLQMIAGRT